MARGRFITNEIARDKKVNDLSDDTSRLAFTWLITFADADGRTYGDPAIILSMLFPRRRDVKIEDMAGYIEEWQAAGLVNWYEANGDLWVEFPNFAKHQMGLRKDREAPSIIPPSGGVAPSYNVATPEVVRSNAGATPAKIGLILIKGKDKEESKERSRVRPPKAEPKSHTLEKYFLRKSSLPAPNGSMDIKERQKQWWTPLASILSWVNGDEDKAQIIIGEAIVKLQRDHLTISDPNSIIKTARSIFAEHNHE